MLVNGTDYFDVDLDMSGSKRKDGMHTESVFVSIIEGSKVFVTVNGLSFADVLLANDLPAADGNFVIKVDTEYTSQSLLESMTLVNVFKNEKPEKLAQQFDLFLDPAYSSMDGRTNTRLLYSQHYEDGTFCDANKKPRRTQVDFYCDSYTSD